MREVRKLLLATVVVALMATGFGACGNGDSTDSSTGAAAPTETRKPAAAAGETGAAQKQDDSNGSASDDAGSSPEGGSSSFRTPGGDNSIQNFGEEADASEREAASAALTGYLQARADDDLAAACAYLAEAAVKPLEELASRSPQLQGKGCGEILSFLIAGVPASTRASTLTGEIDSLRVEGERGFALYHGPKGADYFVSMLEENGEWKVGALEPSVFP